MTKLPDMQRAVNGVDGVAAATMRWPEPEGPAFIRIEFEAEADHGVVTERVLEVLREAGGTDMAGLAHRPSVAGVADDREAASVNGADQGLGAEPGAGASRVDKGPGTDAWAGGGCTPPSPGELGAVRNGRAAAAAAPGGVRDTGPGAAPDTAPGATPDTAPGATPGDGVRQGHGHTRPVLERIGIERTRLDTTLEVTLDLGGRRTDGWAVASGGDRGYDRVAAEATLGAVEQLLPGTVRLDLQDVATTEREGAAPTAHVWLSLVGPGRQEYTVGSAIVRQELGDAVARATLDAVNRWLPALLDGGPLAGVGGDVNAPRHTAAASE